MALEWPENVRIPGGGGILTAMNCAVELFSATDPPHVPTRCVWYWTEFKGARSERLSEYAPVLARAKAILAEHDACVIDRSDKDSGYLAPTLGQ